MMGLCCCCLTKLKGYFRWDYEPILGSNISECDSASGNEDEENEFSQEIVHNGVLQQDAENSFSFIGNTMQSSLEPSQIIPSKISPDPPPNELQRYRSEDNSAGQASVFDTRMLHCQGVTAQSVEIQGSANFTYVTNNETGKFSTKTLEIFNAMKRMLQLRHKQDLMPRLPWMPQYINQLKNNEQEKSSDEPQSWVLRLSTLYVKLALCPKGIYGDVLDEQAIELQHIFDEIQTPETRILVEGPPAYGKSTMAFKVCQDWANGLEEYTKRFQLVILLLLRNFKTNSFLEMLLDHTRVNMPNVNDDDIREVIEKNAANTLLILDGFDEIPEGKQQLLYPLLQGDMLSEATVIVTSRPGSYSGYNNDYVEANDTNTHDSGLMSFVLLDPSTYFYSLFQKRIVIKGIHESQQKQFLHKHLSHSFSETQLDKLNSFLSHNYDRTLFECPLFLLLVAVLAIEANLIEAPKTRTDLYKHLFNFIVKRGLCFLEDYNGSVNLFDYESEDVPVYVLLISKFGELGLNSVKQRQLTFSEQDIVQYFNNSNNHILKLGFMTYKDSLQGLKQNTWYEPVHRTLLEFAAAYYLYYLGKCGDVEKFKANVRSLEPFLPDRSRQVDSLVFTFLSGLMQKNPGLLFVSLLPFRHKYICWWDSHYRSMLSEMGESEELITALSPFITKDWCISCDRDVRFCSSSLHEKIVRRAVENKQIQIIKWDVCSSAKFPALLKVQNFVLNITNQSNFTYRLQCQKIECTNLHCLLQGDDFTRMKKRRWPELMCLLNTFQFACISFGFTASSALKFLPFLLQETKKGYLKNKVFLKLKCELKREKNHLLKLILSLIEVANVEEIHIIIRSANISGMSISPIPWNHNDNELSKKLWADFIYRISDSTCVKVFTLENYNSSSPVRIDEESLRGRGRKQWRSVMVEGYVDLRILERNSQFEDIANGDAGGTRFVRAMLQNKRNTI